MIIRQLLLYMHAFSSFMLMIDKIQSTLSKLIALEVSLPLDTSEFLPQLMLGGLDQLRNVSDLKSLDVIQMKLFQKYIFLPNLSLQVT